MKRIVSILSLAALITTCAFAQDEKGKNTFDLNFNPAAIFDAAASSLFTMPYIKARHFIEPSLAVRMGLGLQFSGSTSYLDPNTDDYLRSTYFGLTLAPGIEKHLGSDKFFIYLGVELPITATSAKHKSRVGNNTYVTKNPTGTSYIGIGLNGIVGADYYIFKNFYIGAELAPGLAFRKYLDSKDNDGDVTAKGGTSTSFSLAASSGLRIGARF